MNISSCQSHTSIASSLTVDHDSTSFQIVRVDNIVEFLEMILKDGVARVIGNGKLVVFSVDRIFGSSIHGTAVDDNIDAKRI